MGREVRRSPSPAGCPCTRDRRACRTRAGDRRRRARSNDRASRSRARIEEARVENTDSGVPTPARNRRSAAHRARGRARGSRVGASVVFYSSRLMRVVTLNVNGIRSAARSGLFEWLPSQAADVVCVQETQAQVRPARRRDLPSARSTAITSTPEARLQWCGDLQPGATPRGIVTGGRLARVRRGGRYMEVRFGSSGRVGVPSSGFSGRQRGRR